MRPDLIKRMVLDGVSNAESYFNDILQWGRDGMVETHKACHINTPQLSTRLILVSDTYGIPIDLCGRWSQTLRLFVQRR